MSRKWIKKYGMNDVLKPLMADITALESVSTIQYSEALKSVNYEALLNR